MVQIINHRGQGDFKKDLSGARRSEIQVAIDRYEKEGWVCIEQTVGKDYRYDLKFRKPNGEIVTVEVKDDKTHASSGNVAIEFKCNGKYSGINKTESDYYIIKARQHNGEAKVYRIKTEVLKAECWHEGNPKPKWEFMDQTSGDNGTAENYLFKPEVLVNEMGAEEIGTVPNDVPDDLIDAWYAVAS